MEYLYILFRIEYLYILFGMGYAYIHQDLDSISAYLNHTTGVYVHTLTYGDIQNNESMCSCYFLRIKYMYIAMVGCLYMEAGLSVSTSPYLWL